MPLGWYLAQGLYPLSPSSSDDEEGPCELPDGRFVCGPHGRVVCGRCATDYSDMNDLLDADEGEEDYEGSQKDTNENEFTDDNNIVNAAMDALDPPFLRRGNGSVIALNFAPPPGTTDPMQVFHGQKTYAQLTR